MFPYLNMPLVKWTEGGWDGGRNAELPEAHDKAMYRRVQQATRKSRSEVPKTMGP